MTWKTLLHINYFHIAISRLSVFTRRIRGYKNPTSLPRESNSLLDACSAPSKTKMLQTPHPLWGLWNRNRSRSLKKKKKERSKAILVGPYVVCHITTASPVHCHGLYRLKRPHRATSQLSVNCDVGTLQVRTLQIFGDESCLLVQKK